MNPHLETSEVTNEKICLQCGAKYSTATELCLDCTDKIKNIQDQSAQIFHEQNQPKTGHLTGIEAVGIRTEHYNWCVRIFGMHQLDDRINRITDHINGIAKEIEILRIKESSARQKRAEYENEFTANLSKEDKERWIKDAEKMRQRQLKREEKEKADPAIQAIKKLVKKGISQADAEWIVDRESNGTKREKMIAGMMKLGIAKEQAELMAGN